MDSPALRTELPKGTVRLSEKHTLVAGGLSSLLKDDYREKVLDAADSGARATAAILARASRLLVLYFTHILSNDNLDGFPTSDDTEQIFYQELVGYAISIFKVVNYNSANRADSRVYKLLVELAETPFAKPDGTSASMWDEFGDVDAKGLGAILHSYAKSWAVNMRNHLRHAWKQHTTLYLKAKYAELKMSAKEVTQLAQTIGKSVEFNEYRDEKGRQPYMKLPRARGEQRDILGHISRQAVTDEHWQALVDDERQLLPETSSDWDLLQNRWRMLQAIDAASTPSRIFKGFTILPIFGAGRCFMKLNTAGLYELVSSRGQVNIAKGDVLKIFKPKKLDKLMRHAKVKPSDKTQPLELGGEFFRTNGVAAQFYCGLTRGIKRDRKGIAMAEGDDDECDPNDGWDEPEDKGDIADDAIPTVESEDELFSDDPGKHCYINIGRVEKVSDEPFRPGQQPTGDGTFVNTKLAYRLTARRWGEMRGYHRARRRRKQYTNVDAYKAALDVFSRHSCAVSNAQTLGLNMVMQGTVWAQVHAVEGSRKMARLKFDAYMRQQSAINTVCNEVFAVLGDTGVLAVGSGRWKSNSRGTKYGSDACGMIHRQLFADPRSRFENGRRRLFNEPEQYSSQKCSNCLGPFKMVHPKHALVYGNEWIEQDGRIVKVREAKRRAVHGQYQCTAGTCHCTWDRDRNAIANIWRTAWERMHGRLRPITLQHP